MCDEEREALDEAVSLWPYNRRYVLTNCDGSLQPSEIIQYFPLNRYSCFDASQSCQKLKDIKGVMGAD